MTEAGHKIHAYWRLTEPATGPAIDAVCKAREAAALAFGGDPAFKQPAQVIRIPGSVHRKGAPVLVRLRTVRPEVEYSLSAITDSLVKYTTADNEQRAPVQVAADWFDFNTAAVPGSDVDRALTAPVHEGGVDDMTRFEAAGKAIGHFIRMIREGKMTEAEAWEAVKGWNIATLVPAWDEARLRNDFERLLRRDLQSNGPVAVKAVAPVWAVPDWKVENLYARSRYKGRAPERRWLVDNLIPYNTAGVFAAVGDAGKSMLALSLANMVSSYPAGSGIMDSGNPRFFGRPVVRRGTAVFLGAEDDDAEMHRRLEGLDPEGVWRGEHARLIVLRRDDLGTSEGIVHCDRSGPRLTVAFDRLRELLLKIDDLALVVVDPLSLFVTGDTNDNLTGSVTMGAMNRLAGETGAAVMLIHHFAKNSTPSGLADARNSIRGAGAWVDNGRWALTIWEAGEDDAYKALKALGQPERAKNAGVVYFGGLAKGNAPGEKTLRTFVRNARNGLLEDVTDAVAAGTPRQAELDERAFQALRDKKRMDDRYSFTRGKQSLCDEVYPVLRKAGIDVTQRDVPALFERLQASGRIIETQMRRSGRTVFEPNMLYP
jgi:hypothetical protein